MITKCKNCGSFLTFDAELQMMVCDYCSSMFPVDEIEKEDEQKIDTEAAQSDSVSLDSAKSDLSGHAMELMDFNIYHCSSCGAELVMNDVEATTYCAYCGQPTVVFEKIAKRRKPDAMIPFMISKEKAVELIRQEFGKSQYVSDAVRAFKPEMVRGVYIPFGIYDIEYEDRQLISGNIEYNKGADKKPCNFFRHVRSKFHDIPVDASIRLPNNYSERLEPYNTNALEDFKPEYLSGFYADLGDEDFGMIKQRAIIRAGKMFDEQVQARIVYGKDLTIAKKHPKIQVLQESYVLLPAWFLIFEFNGRKYTILVNGQTGKVFGSVPINAWNLVKSYVIAAFFISIFCICAMPVVLLYLQSYKVAILLSWAMIVLGIANFLKLRKSIRYTQEASIREFASDRKRG